MQKKLKVLLIVMLSTILLSGIYIAPVLGITKQEAKTEKERTQAEIENGFSNYLVENKISPYANRTREFSTFLRSNPAFQEQLSEYTNLFIKEHDDNSKPLQLSDSTVGPIFKTVNTTINGTNYEATFRRGISLDGTEFVRINFGCNGTDPEYLLNYYYLSMGGVNYGEVATIAVHFPAANDEALQWKQNFDTAMLVDGTFQTALWAIGAIALTVVGGSAGALAGIVAGSVSESNLGYLILTVDNAYSETNGISIKLVGTYIYPLFIAHLLEANLQIFALQGSSWVLAYPLVNSYYYDIVFGSPVGKIALLEANAWAISNMVHTLGNSWGYGIWHQLPDPPTPPANPPSGAGLLKEVTWNSYDTTGNTYANGADMLLDDHPFGTSGSTLYLTPEEHVFSSPLTYHLYENGYQFFGYEQWGTENEVVIAITSDITITANYVETQWLYLSASEPSTGTVWTDIYIDNNYVGNGAVDLEIPRGSHSVSVAYQTVHWGELVTLDYILVDEQSGSSNIYLSDTPKTMEFVYRFGQ